MGLFPACPRLARSLSDCRCPALPLYKRLWKLPRHCLDTTFVKVSKSSQSFPSLGWHRLVHLGLDLVVAQTGRHNHLYLPLVLIINISGTTPSLLWPNQQSLNLSPAEALPQEKTRTHTTTVLKTKITQPDTHTGLRTTQPASPPSARHPHPVCVLPFPSGGCKHPPLPTSINHWWDRGEVVKRARESTPSSSSQGSTEGVLPPSCSPL
ncbi:hypothetical protein B0T20DRAFT_195607 [Sordaria brevicollis]|uniref:Uncharacterized protein n=1 Tax=Sordaria brevicollis TaxID=83679 RepID=A0AAE0UD09_SORBR|nr:hypothetical protein B0T20DRAFT_195607 [Sordaria brevicollis]